MTLVNKMILVLPIFWILGTQDKHTHLSQIIEFYSLNQYSVKKKRISVSL